MRKTIAPVAVTVAALAALALGAGSAGASVPNGNGLVGFGVFSCDGLGDVEVIGPKPSQVPMGHTADGRTFVLYSLSIVFTSPTGDVDTLSKTWGTKAGLVALTCTQHFEDPGAGSGDATAVIGLVPAR